MKRQKTMLNLGDALTKSGDTGSGNLCDASAGNGEYPFVRLHRRCKVADGARRVAGFEEYARTFVFIAVGIVESHLRAA